MLTKKVDYHDIPNVTKDVAERINKFLDLYGDQLPFPEFHESTLDILEKRYLLRDRDGRVAETPASLLARVAIGVVMHRMKENPAKAFHDAFDYYKMMAAMEFLPNSPTIMNAGTKMGQLSACFVVPVGDSMSEIMDAVKSVALIHQSGGGTGMDFSDLRPEGSTIRSTGGEASGPVSFMKIFDATTQEIKQGGKRRGANMGMLRIDHPDVLQFITCKDTDGVLSNFNISVGVTDEFMSALDGGSDNEVFEGHGYWLKDPKDGYGTSLVDARDVWQLLVDHAWIGGDPGVVFIDTINKKNPFDVERFPEHIMRATNPCGEQPLEGYEACNLGSVNLNRCMRGDSVTGKFRFNFGDLERITILAVKFLNDVVDSNRFPIEEIDTRVRANRKIGLGVMGLADVLIWTGVPYGSEAGRNVANEIMHHFSTYAREASESLAEASGETFATFDHMRKDTYPRRNATLTTIAPTGTIGMFANASGGIEPVFALYLVKTVMDGAKFPNLHPYVDHLYANDLITEDDLEYVKRTGQPSPAMVEAHPGLSTAYMVDAEDHLLMQSTVQHYVDNAVSKTINLPNAATSGDIDSIYRLAYQTGCKGVTVYRDGSKYGQVLTAGEDKKEDCPDCPELPAGYDALAQEVAWVEDAEKQAALAVDEVLDGTHIETNRLDCESCPAMQKDLHVASRPEVMIGITTKAPTGCGSLYVTINEDEDGAPVEVFSRLGKGGNCAGASAEVVGRLVSNMLRAGIPVDRVVKQLLHVSCGRPSGFGPNKSLSCYDAMGQVLSRYAEGELHSQLVDDVEPVEIVSNLSVPISQPDPVYVPAAGGCPSCGGTLMMSEGCMTCPSCSWSKCS